MNTRTTHTVLVAITLAPDIMVTSCPYSHQKLFWFICKDFLTLLWELMLSWSWSQVIFLVSDSPDWSPSPLLQVGTMFIGCNVRFYHGFMKTECLLPSDPDHSFGLLLFNMTYSSILLPPFWSIMASFALLNIRTLLGPQDKDFQASRDIRWDWMYKSFKYMGQHVQNLLTLNLEYFILCLEIFLGSESASPHLHLLQN